MGDYRITFNSPDVFFENMLKDINMDLFPTGASFKFQVSSINVFPALIMKQNFDINSRILSYQDSQILHQLGLLSQRLLFLRLKRG